MTSIPRNTPWFQKRAAARLQDLKAARKDPVIGPAWDAARWALARTLAHGAGKPFPLSQEDSEALWAESAHDRAIHQDYLHQLLALSRQHAPHLDREFGAQLGEFIGICHFAELGLDQPTELGKSTARHSPDNPIERLAENIWYIPENVTEFKSPEHRRTCLLELNGYLTALQEDRKPGRPPKERSEKSRIGQQKQDHEWDAQAREAYRVAQQLAEKGQKDWQAIALALGHTVPRDRNARKALHAKIGRLTHRGRILSTLPE